MKLILNNLASLSNEASALIILNQNNAATATALEKTLSRDGTAPNQMGADFDMNSHQILNLPAPSNPTSPVRLADVVGGISGITAPTGTSGHVVPYLDGINTWSGLNNFVGGANFTGTTLTTNVLIGNSLSTNTLTNNTLNINTMTNNTLTGSTFDGVTTFSTTPTFPSNTFWNNTRLGKTSGYTVTNADKFLTLVLGGGTYYTLALSAAGSYDANFFIFVLNEDTVRGKLISCNGLSSFVLYPGQSCFIYAANGLWNINPSFQRWGKAGAAFFVDSVNGNNSNDGLVAGAGGAFATITKAVSVLTTDVDCKNASPTINLAAGTYTEAVTLQGQITGVNFFNIIGAGSTVVTWKPSGFCLLVGDNAEVAIQGIKFDNAGGANNAIGISMHQDSVIDIGTDIDFGSFPTTGSSRHINSDVGGFINLPASYKISGLASWHINAGPGTVITQASGGTITFTGTYTIALLYRFQGTKMSFAGAVTYTIGTVTVTSAYSVDFLSFIALNSTTLPGGAGTSAHGSQVA